MDVSEEKRQAALEAGASQAVDGSGEGVAGRIKEAAGGPVGAIIDVVNATSTVVNDIASLARGGKVVLVGMFGGRLELPLMMFPAQAICIQGNSSAIPRSCAPWSPWPTPAS